MEFIQELYRRNRLFFYLSLGFFALFFVFLIGFAVCQFHLHRICLWLKPFKFSLSFALYTASLGWYMEYLQHARGKRWIGRVSGLIAGLVLLEMGIIFMQSFFVSDPNASRNLFLLGTFVIILNTAAAAYVGWQFFDKIRLTPLSYLWGIRAGFALFVFSGILGGFLVWHYGQAPVDSSQYGMPLTQFSVVKDNMISLHFIGTHSLQLIPFLSYFFSLGRVFALSSIGFYAIASVILMMKA